MSKASIEQIVELVSFHLSFISNLTTSLTQTEEATCCSVIVFACIENTPVPKDNEDGEDSADGTADLLWHTSDKGDKLINTLLTFCLACLRLSGIIFFTLLYLLRIFSWTDQGTDGKIYLILGAQKGCVMTKLD